MGEVALTERCTRERVEQIRAMNTMRLPNGKGFLLRTHKNAAVYDLLDFIDQHLPHIETAP